jgi:hypothetical protein
MNHEIQHTDKNPKYDPKLYGTEADAWQSNEGATKVKEAAEKVSEEARSLLGQASNQAKSTVLEQKNQAAGQLHGLAQVLRQTGKQLRQQEQVTFAGYSNQVADQVERVSGYLQERDVDQLIGDTKDFARRQPELFIGGAFMLGLLAARFMKSSSPEYPTPTHTVHSAYVRPHNYEASR